MLKPTKILVPTDFTGYADKALKQALYIAADYGAEVHVVHVVHERIHGTLSDDYSDISITEETIKKLQKNIVVKAKVRLERQIRKLPESKKVKVEQIVTSGVPYDKILQEEKRVGADLIVIASLGSSGIGRFLIGSVARNVLRGAACPVLLTKDVFLLKPQRILVPTDFSSYSDKAVKQGLDIARQYGAKLFLLHVLPILRQYAFDYALPEEMMIAAEKQSEDISVANMKKQLGKFAKAKEVEATMDLARGLVYEAILEEAQKKEIDLIVIASLGQSGIAKYLIGSVARNVLKGATCPVLVTK
jgi:universal stress protein A